MSAPLERDDGRIDCNQPDDLSAWIQQREPVLRRLAESEYSAAWIGETLLRVNDDTNGVK